jgi:hydrogenase expression/formation protein HypC
MAASPWARSSPRYAGAVQSADVLVAQICNLLNTILRYHCRAARRRVGWEAMCLAVPGKITSISGDDPLMRTGKVDFGGILKDVGLAFVPEAQIGEYVIVHVGFALSRVDEAEAQQIFQYLREMQELSELEESRAGVSPAPPDPTPTAAGPPDR